MGRNAKNSLICGCILGGAGRADDGGIYDGAGVGLDAARLQLFANPGKQHFTEPVVIEQASELEHGGRIRHGLGA